MPENPGVPRLDSRGGTFAAGTGPVAMGTTPVQIGMKQDLLFDADNSTTGHVVTITGRGGQGTWTRFVPAGASTVFEGAGIDRIAIDAADGQVTWEVARAGAFAGLAHPSNSPVSFPSGGSLVDDLTGGVQFVGASGGIIDFASNGALTFGAGNNLQFTASGICSVFGTYATGGAGLPAILGGSPTPAQGGPLHFAANWKVFSAAGDGTTECAGWEPQAGTHIDWLEIDVYVDIVTNTGNAGTVTILITYFEEQAGASTTQTLMLEKDNGATGTNTGATTGKFHGHTFVPNTQPAVLGNNVVLVQAQITGTTPAVTMAVVSEIKRIGVIAQN